MHSICSNNQLLLYISPYDTLALLYSHTPLFPHIFSSHHITIPPDVSSYFLSQSPSHPASALFFPHPSVSCARAPARHSSVPKARNGMLGGWVAGRGEGGGWYLSMSLHLSGQAGGKIREEQTQGLRV